MSEVSGRAFRDALSAFATGVTIVTTGEGGEPVGMTASSFNSVSLDPPLILWSVTEAALSAPAFIAARHFSVHILAGDQSGLADRFAKSGADKFAGADHTLDARGVPILPGVAARFDCSTWAVHPGGDHRIIVGHVDAVERFDRPSLIFGGGSYKRTAPLESI